MHHRYATLLVVVVSALSFSARHEDLTLPPPAASEMIGPAGQCAAQAVAGAETPGMAQGGISLQMTECEVVRVAGYTDRVEIGGNERGQRSVTLTYMGGPRPGIYRFLGGRLASMERVAEPVQPKKPQKTTRPRRSPRRGNDRSE